MRSSAVIAAVTLLPAALGAVITAAPQVPEERAVSNAGNAADDAGKDNLALKKTRKGSGPKKHKTHAKGACTSGSDFEFCIATSAGETASAAAYIVAETSASAVSSGLAMLESQLSSQLATVTKLPERLAILNSHVASVSGSGVPSEIPSILSVAAAVQTGATLPPSDAQKAASVTSAAPAASSSAKHNAANGAVEPPSEKVLAAWAAGVLGVAGFAIAL